MGRCPAVFRRKVERHDRDTGVDPGAAAGMAIAPLDLAAQAGRLRGDRIERAIQRVVEHGRFIMGPEVLELEERLAAFCGAPHAVSCSSGTDALLLALMAWGVGPGDAVFVPAFTFAASAEVVVLAAPLRCSSTSIRSRSTSTSPAWRPRWTADLGLRRCGRDRRRPSSGSRRGLRRHPVPGRRARHVGARRRGPVVRSTFHGHGAGTYADAVATSFFPTKPLGCYGDGGAVFTADAEMADRLRSHRVHGQGQHAYDHPRIGMTGRLDTIQAAVLLQKLDILGEEIAARQRLADGYSRRALRRGRRARDRQPGHLGVGAVHRPARPPRRGGGAHDGSGRAHRRLLPDPPAPAAAYARFPVAPGRLPAAEALSQRVPQPSRAPRTWRGRRRPGDRRPAAGRRRHRQRRL